MISCRIGVYPTLLNFVIVFLTQKIKQMAMIFFVLTEIEKRKGLLYQKGPFLKELKTCSLRSNSRIIILTNCGSYLQSSKPKKFLHSVNDNFANLDTLKKESYIPYDFNINTVAMHFVINVAFCNNCVVFCNNKAL